MKKLNITKKQFGESKYFTNKYGTLKYVSENGKFYRTSKGQVLKFLKESSTIIYINEVKFRNELEDVFTSAISDLDDDNMKLYAEDLLDEYIDGVVEDTHKSMNKYLHSKSTSMTGNFADVELDYSRDFKDADFRDVVDKIDNGMEDSETKQFRDWLVDWYFKAFGTYNLKYNFMEFVSEFTADYEDDTYDESEVVKESSDFSSQESEVTIHWLIDDEALGITVDDEETVVVDLDLIDPEYPDTLVEAVQSALKKMYKGMSFEYDEDFIIKNEDEFWNSLGVKPNRTGITYESGDKKMKKLNITKEAYNKSKYFQTKYGKLKYVSESGNAYKTDKDVVLEFRMPSFGEIGDALDDGVSKIKKLIRKKPQFKVGDCVTCYKYSDEKHGKGKGAKVGI